MQSDTGPIRLPNQGPAQAGWLAEVELLRGCAILGVIAIHSLAGSAASPTTLRAVSPLMVVTVMADRLAHYAVPLFVLLSGVVLAAGYTERFALGAFYRRRMASILPPYLAFSALYIVCDAYLARRLQLGAAILALLTASSAYHMWFVGLIAQLYALYPALIRLCAAWERRHAASDHRCIEFVPVVGAFVVQGMWSVAAISIEEAAPWPITKVVLPTVCLGYLLYFVLGIQMGRDWDTWLKRVCRLKSPVFVLAAIVLALALSALWLLGLGRYRHVRGIDIYPLYLAAPALLEPALYLTILFLLLKLAHAMTLRPGPAARVLGALGRYSFGIYLLHVLVRDALAGALGSVRLRGGSWLYYPALFLGTTLLSFAAVHLIGRLPHSERIIGLRRAPQDGSKRL